MAKPDRKRRFDPAAQHPSLLMPVSWGVAVVIGAAVLITAELTHKAKVIAQETASSKRWAASGPPCPPLPADPRQRLEITRRDVFSFNGVQFMMQFGWANCNVVSAGAGPLGYGLMCRFSSPATIYVTTNGRVAKFQPGIGRPATVFVAHGQVRCVMAGGPAYQSKSASRPA